MQLEFEWGDWITPDQISLFDEDQPVKVRWNDGGSVTNDGLTKVNFAPQNWVDGSIDAFAVPADHAYYLAKTVGFEYWPGRYPSPPSDWAGGKVKLRNGRLGVGVEWRHDPYGRGEPQPSDIIGYRRKPRVPLAQPTTPPLPPAPAADEPPFWALNRASEEIGNLVTPATALTALARYIARHETAPVDPDVLAVRTIVALYCEGWGGMDEAQQIRDGLNDDGPAFQRALEAYRAITSGGVVDVPSS